jgi:uncharacterized delta-60 repeat protein
MKNYGISKIFLFAIVSLFFGLAYWAGNEVYAADGDITCTPPAGTQSCNSVNVTCNIEWSYDIVYSTAGWPTCGVSTVWNSGDTKNFTTYTDLRLKACDWNTEIPNKWKNYWYYVDSDFVAPTFTNSVNPLWNIFDTITADRGNANIRKWKYHDLSACPSNASSYDNDSTSSMNQSDQSNNGKYICLFGRNGCGTGTIKSANPIKIDITAPVTTIVPNWYSICTWKTIPVTVSCNDAGMAGCNTTSYAIIDSGQNCSSPSVNWSSQIYGAPFTINVVWSTTHYNSWKIVCYKSIDNVSNEESLQQSPHFLVDKVWPTEPIKYYPINWVTLETTTPTFVWSGSIERWCSEFSGFLLQIFNWDNCVGSNIIFNQWKEKKVFHIYAPGLVNWSYSWQVIPKDALGNTWDFSCTNFSIYKNTLNPTVSSVSSPNNLPDPYRHRENEVVEVLINFDKPVKITWIPTIELDLRRPLTPTRYAQFDKMWLVDNDFQVSWWGEGFDGTVRSITMQGSDILVGGNFVNYKWTGAKYIARLNPDGTRDFWFKDRNLWLNNNVNTITQQSDGKILIGGNFTLPKLWILRVLNDGTLDAGFNSPLAWGSVNTIVQQSDGKIIVGGNFDKRILRLDSNGSVDTSFNVGIGFNTTVNSIVVMDDGKIIVGGNFTSYSWTTVNRIARLTTTWLLDTSFLVGSGFNNNVKTLVRYAGSDLLVGGDFTNYSWTTVGRIVRLKSNWILEDLFVLWAWFNNPVENIVIDWNWQDFFVGGRFTSYKWLLSQRIAKLDGLWNRKDFNNSYWFDSDVYALAIAGGKLIVGGSFGFHTQDSFNKANKIFRLTDDGKRDETFDFWIWFNNSVFAMVKDPLGRILIGGDFEWYAWLENSRLIRLNTNWSKDTSFDIWWWFNKISDSVLALATDRNSNVFVGGNLSTYQWIPVSDLVFLSRTWVFIRDIPSINSTVRTLFVDGGNILAGGDFSNHIVRLKISDWTPDTDFKVGWWFNGPVYSIVKQWNKYIVGGNFTSYSWTAVGE